MPWRIAPSRCPIVPQLFCALVLFQVLLACLLDVSWVRRGGSLVVP